MSNKPSERPKRPFFSSGPCAKRPGWTISHLDNALLGRSHRSKPGRTRLAELINLSREILGLPSDWRLGIVPASDTGAVEMALWSLLGPRPVDVLSFESFSADWALDITRQLKLDAKVMASSYGEFPDTAGIDWSHDVVLAWNGTTSGVRVPDGIIPAHHSGLVICDATSAVFAMNIPWDRLDVVTWSWQKAMGGEAGHGMLALGPKAVERLLTHEPGWPMPKIFRLTQRGALNEGLFRGETINTPSMLAVEDQIDALKWARSIGGLATLVERTRANSDAIARWVEQSPWTDFLALDEEARSPTSVCLRLVEPWVKELPIESQRQIAAAIVDVLEREGVAFDVGAYRDAPPGLRIWCGPTVEYQDIVHLLPWLDWGFGQSVQQFKQAV